MSVSQDDVMVPLADDSEIDRPVSESWVAEQVRLLTLEEGFA